MRLNAPERWDDVNSLDFLRSVQLHGPIDGLRLDENFRKRRFPGQHPNHDEGGAEVDDAHSTLRVFWHELRDWRLTPGVYGRLVLLAEFDGAWHAWPIKDLARSDDPGKDERRGTTIVKAPGEVWDSFLAPRNQFAPTASIPAGSLCGLAVVAANNERRTDVLPFLMPEVPVPPPPPPPEEIPQGLRGRQIVMAPEALDDIPHLGAWFRDVVLAEGWHGIHIVLLGRRTPGLRVLVELCAKHGLWVHVWAFGDVQAGTAPADGLLSDESLSYFAWVLDEAGWYADLSLAPGYDVEEWVSSDRQIGAWIAWVHDYEREHGLPRHICGARSHGGTLDLDWPSSEYAGFDVHVPSGAAADGLFRQMAVLAGERVPFWGERGRRRNEGEGKDFDDDLVDAVEAAVRHHVASIWGNIPTNDYNAGSLPLPPALRDRLREVLAPVEPPPPPADEPTAPDVRRWQLIVFDKVDRPQVREQLVADGWRAVRLEVSPGYTRWDSGRGAEIVWAATDAGFAVMLGVVGRGEDVADSEAFYDYVVDLEGRIDLPHLWCVDLEVSNTRISYDTYMDAVAPLVRHLVANGGRVLGPGADHGHPSEIRAFLDELAPYIHLPTAHAYWGAGRSFEETRAWLDAAESEMRRHGFTSGYLSEAGAHGQPAGCWDSTLAALGRWDGDEEQRRRLAVAVRDIQRRAFWRGAAWYQIHETERWGLALYRDDMTPKPALDAIRPVLTEE